MQGGEWISTIEIENLAMGHRDVAEAAVVAIPNKKYGCSLAGAMCCICLKYQSEQWGGLTCLVLAWCLRQGASSLQTSMTLTEFLESSRSSAFLINCPVHFFAPRWDERPLLVVVLKPHVEQEDNHERVKEELYK